MRGILIFLALGSLACFGGGARYRIRNTPEGAECARQCTVVENTCLAGNQSYFNRDSYCANQRENCRATCPGAESY